MQRFFRLSRVLKNTSVFQRLINEFSLAENTTSISGTTKTMASNANNKVDNNNFEGMIKFLELVGNLKHVKRTGWVLRDIKDCESISGHMYRMSMMTFLLNGQEGLDRIKCMQLALVHDLAESVVGDITPYCGVSREDKKMREQNAMEDIAKLIAPRGQLIMDLFTEYEESKTPESKFVKDLDRLDMILQAFEYEKRDNCIKKHQEFFDSTDGKISHPFIKELVKEILMQRETLDNQPEKQQASTSS